MGIAVKMMDILDRVDAGRLKHDIFHLCKDPLPFRKVNYTVPGHAKNTLEETDDFIVGELARVGLQAQRTVYRVQPFRCDETKPIHHWYSAPAPQDPFYDACNIEVEIPGSVCPDEIIQLISHKDSMSWIDSPGAHDNGCGTVANLEIARVLGSVPLDRTVRILFCNEEHTPWTSRFAAEEAYARGDAIIAVLNVDSIDGKPDADMAAGKLSHVVGYSTEEGRPLADLVAALNCELGLGLELQVMHKERVNDDDGMFINAGFRHTVMNLGSWPYRDSEYHLPGDVPERVDIENLKRSTQLVLATVLTLSRDGQAT